MQKSSVVREPLIHITKRKAMRPAQSFAIRVAAFFMGMVICGAVAFLLIDGLRANPGKIGEFYYSFIKGSIATERKLWTFFKNIAILLCIAVALTPAFRMRFWNIGAEGQALVGVLAAVGANFYFGGKFNPNVVFPNWLLLLVMLLAALIAGAIWGVIPALFKAKWDTNETLFTLMMNYVATFLVTFFLQIWVPNGSGKLDKLSSGAFPYVFSFLPKSSYSDYLVIIIIVLIVTAGMYIYLNSSKHGYELNVVGESLRTASYIGINVKKVIIRTMILSGALCGLAGWLIGAGLDRSVTTESVGGQGFTAILVAWLGKFNPIMMIMTAGIVIFLNQGASQIASTFNVPDTLPNIIIGIVLFFIIGSEFFINYKLNFRKHK